ncbi:hypothetical protein D3C84_538260 [compost metagenome]
MRLAAPGFRPGLEPSATADERHQLLLRPQLAVAPREDEHARRALAAGRQESVPRARPGLQHPRRTRRLAAQRATAQPQPTGHLPRCRRRRHGAERLRGQGLAGRQPAFCLRTAGQPGELPAQHVHLALQPAGLLGQGPRVHAQVPARNQKRRDERRHRPGRRLQTRRSRMGGRGRHRQARSGHHPGLPHVLDLRLFRHRVADRNLVRKRRHEHLGHAPVHSPVVGRDRPGVGIAFRLGNLQRHRQGVFQHGRRAPGRRKGSGDHSADARQRRRTGPAVWRHRLEKRRRGTGAGQERTEPARGRA